MASERNPNPMKLVHIDRLQENWKMVAQFLEFKDIIYILEDDGVLDKRDIELIEGYSTKQGFKYLFAALTEYGGANGLYAFVEALKTKGNKYATIIAELSEGLSTGETKVDPDDKDVQISTLERQLKKERQMRKTLEKKLKKMKSDSAFKDKEIDRLTDKLNEVSQRVKSLENTIDEMRTWNDKMKQQTDGMKQQTDKMKQQTDEMKQQTDEMKQQTDEMKQQADEMKKLLQGMKGSGLNSQTNTGRKTTPSSTRSLSGIEQLQNQGNTSALKPRLLPHLQSPRK